MKVRENERFVVTGSLVEKKGNKEECMSISWFVFPEIEVIYCGFNSLILPAASWSAENAFFFFVHEVQSVLRNGFQRRQCQFITKAFARTSTKDVALKKVASLQ